MEHETQEVTPVETTDTTPVTESRSVARRRAIQTAPTTPTTAPKQKRAPAVKPRSLEELDMLDAKKMTPAETVLYINALRDVLLRQKAQGEELNKVAKSSFEQFRNADETLNKIKAQADADIALAKQIINTAAKSIALIGGQH